MAAPTGFILVGEYRCRIADIQDYEYRGQVATANGAKFQIVMLRRNKVKYCYFQTDEEARKVLDYLDNILEVKKL